MKQIYIVGAGGFGREVYNWMSDVLDLGSNYSFKGFLDDNIEALDGFLIDAEVKAIADYSYSSEDLLICGIGNPFLKKKLCLPLMKMGCDFLTLIHPSAIIGPSTKIGKGSVICPKVVITCDIIIGEMVTINLMTTVGHDAKIGSWSTVSAQCDITGYVEIEESVFMGSGARVIPKKKVGTSATIGAGSVVIREVSPYSTVFGNPAREIF